MILCNILQKKQIIKFILVGALNTIFGYGLFVSFIFFGLYYPWAVFLSTILGVLFNFKTIGKLVFNSNNDKLIFKFVLVYMSIYCLNVFFLWLLKRFGFENMYMNGFVLLVPLSIISFILNKIFVFKG